MKIVIDIPDNYDLSKIQNGSIASKILLNCIKNGTPLSSVEPARKMGKWHVEGFDAWCTNCGFHPTAIEVFDYCPSCGAKMEVSR